MATQYKAGRVVPFIQVPVDLLSDPRCDCFTIAAYVALRSFCDFGSEAGAFPSDTAAAARAGMGPRTFRDRRTRLREMGWVEWDSGKQNGKTNTYTVHATLAPPQADLELVPEGRQEMPTPSAGDADPPRQEVPTTYIQDNLDSIPKRYADVFRQREADVTRLWYAWEQERADALGIPVRKQKVTWKRVRGILDAFILDYSMEDCRDVIHGCCHRPHNVQGGYLDIELMFRDQPHIEMYIHYWRSIRNGNGTGPSTSDTKRALEAMYG